MKKLAVMPDSALAHVLLQRLDEAGIAATMTTEHTPAGLYLGTRQVVIWISDDADVELARQLVQESQMRVIDKRCPYCGYDLRAHSGAAICPECGQPALLPPEGPDRECTRCGESSPPTFSVCWNCGGDLPDASRPARHSESE